MTQNLYVPLAGWGRNINHDPRSVAYTASQGASVTPRDVGWNIHIAPMDQGNLGSCVAHAGTAMLACDPFWDTLSPELMKTLNDPAKAEQFALQLYRDVTASDPYPGQWEPDDTGSDGLSLAKVLQGRKLDNGYQHVMSVDDAHAAIQRGPYPIGISWLSGMDSPGNDGVVKVTGATRGGHEILMYRYDLARDLWWCRNSWSDSFGLKGDFAFDTAGYQKLMALKGDGTPMTPVTAPAPVPTPTPAPVPTPGADFPYAEMDAWLNKFGPHWPRYERSAAEAYKAWRATHG